MAAGRKGLIGALILAAAALGALIATDIADDPAPAVAAQIVDWDSVEPAMKPAAAGGGPVLSRKPGGGTESDRRRKRRRPSITDLVTTNPVSVGAGSGRIAVLSCGKSMGIALDGGVITPPNNSQVVVSVLSRANPNPPFANSRRNYYVGVSNLGTTAATFRGTLVCARGIEIR